MHFGSRDSECEGIIAGEVGFKALMPGILVFFFVGGDRVDDALTLV
jgi:hypothetical protein